VEGDLLGLGEEVGRVPVEHQRADDLHRRQLLRHDLGRVEQVDALEGLLGGVGEDLDAQLPLGEGAVLDGVVEVAAVEVRVDAGGDLRLLPGEGVHAELRLPVELDQDGLPVGVDQPERVDAEALHRPVAARDAPVAHVPDRVVGRLGVEGDEVPEGVVRRLRLRDLAVGVRLAGVDDVRELDRVLDEEDRDVVAYQVPGAFLRVELRRESAGVPDGVGRAARPEDRREADEDRRLQALLGEHGGARHRHGGAVGREDAVRAGAAGVHHALRDPLVVEVHDLLAQVEVLEQDRTARPPRERVVAVGDAHPVRRGQLVAGLLTGIPALLGAVVADPRGADGARGLLVGLACGGHGVS
jgi:hypothetical protein